MVTGPEDVVEVDVLQVAVCTVQKLCTLCACSDRPDSVNT